jgi:hypothetical protein
MNNRKTIASLLGVVGFALVAGAAQAQVTLGNSSPNTNAQNVTYTGGATPTFTLSDGNQEYKDLYNPATFGNVTVNLSLGPSAISNYTLTGGGTGFSEMLTGTGSFSIVNNVGGATLLSGTFGTGSLSGSTDPVTHAETGGLTISNLTYTGGTRLDGQGPLGSMSVEFVNANFTFNSTSVSSFTAKDSATYTANTPAGVPEPGTYAAFLVGGLGVLGLMVGARKRSMVA